MKHASSDVFISLADIFDKNHDFFIIKVFCTRVFCRGLGTKVLKNSQYILKLSGYCDICFINERIR